MSLKKIVKRLLGLRSQEELISRSHGVSQWGLAWRRFRKNKVAIFGIITSGSVVFMAIFAPLIAPYDPQQDWFVEGLARKPPSSEHLLGTDRMGRDVLSGVIYGSRSALFVGLFSTMISLMIGLPIGAFAGYFGGKLDEVLMRFTEAVMVLPSFLFILFFIKILSSSFTEFNYLAVVSVVIGLFGWPWTARMLRAEFLKIKNMDFIEGAKCLGTSELRIIFRHIFPSALPTLMVLITLGIAGRILSEATITFLGFGDPLAVSWGSMLAMGRDALTTAWWETVFPGIFLFLTSLGFNLLGDGLADSINPRLRQ